MDTRARLAAPLFGLVLGAAAAAPVPQTFDTHLIGDGAVVMTGPTIAARPIDVPAVKADGYERAPMPDQDVAGPSGGAADDAPGLTPTLLNTKAEYSGAGYTSKGSSADGKTEARKTPGVGLGLSVPME